MGRGWGQYYHTCLSEQVFQVLPSNSVGQLEEGGQWPLNEYGVEEGKLTLEM